MFDIRIKFDPPDIDDLSLNDDKVVRDNSANSKLKNDNSMIFDLCCDSNKLIKIHNSKDDSSSDAKTACGSEENYDPNTAYDDSDSDSDSLFELDDNSDTNDECTADSEETRSFLYRHFTIYIVPNPDPGKPNTIFTKITLIHTKDENNNPRL